jgi:hypothetical protein
MNNYSCFALLSRSTSTGYDHKSDLQSFLSEYYITLWLKFSNDNKIRRGHRWLMRFNLQQSNGFDAICKSTGEHFLWKCDLSPPNMCFRLSIWAKGHRESQKYKFPNEYLEQTRRPGWLFFLQIQLKKLLLFASRRLVGAGRTWTISPKLVPTPLILLVMSPPCTEIDRRISARN